MKFNKTVLGLALALVMTPSWGHGEHGSNTVWKTTDGHQVLSANGECVRAFDFASLGRNSCHAPEIVEVPVVAEVVVPVVAEVVVPVVAEVVVPVEVVEAAAPMAVLSVEPHKTSVYFDTNSAALSMESKMAIDGVIDASLDAEVLLAVQVVGHADSRGDTDYNLNLSQDRVDAVVAHLAARGITTSSSFAQGEARPVMENGTENLSASRRADVLIKAQVKTMN
jgi:outer membrane protein OmpA-like peptidoglycan-associated protein